MKQTLCSISVIIIVMSCHPYWAEEYGVWGVESVVTCPNYNNNL